MSARTFISSSLSHEEMTLSSSEEPGSELRMKLLLEYARCACNSFWTPAHGPMLANAYGALIGSLQGTDENSPEVAVVVACLRMLCDRLMRTTREMRETEKSEAVEDSGGDGDPGHPGNPGNPGNPDNTDNPDNPDNTDNPDNHTTPDRLRMATVGTGVEVLTIALELVPGTALVPVWGMVVDVVQSSNNSRLLMSTLANNISNMEDGSRRSVLTRKLLQINPPQSKL